MNTLEAILTRRSTRQFLPKYIEEAKLAQILEAGMSGPSCVNAKDWQFIIVNEKKTLEKMADANGKPAQLLKNADIGILVCADTDKAFVQAKEYWIIDCAIAAENICLAAQELGIGSCWLGTWPQMERVNAQKELFQLPENIIPHSIIALGYPINDITEERNSRFDEEKVHMNAW